MAGSWMKLWSRTVCPCLFLSAPGLDFDTSDRINQSTQFMRSKTDRHACRPNPGATQDNLQRGTASLTLLLADPPAIEISGQCAVMHSLALSVPACRFSLE